MRTIEQILEKFGEQHSELDNSERFCYADLLQFIPFRTVYPYLEDKLTPAEWGAYYMPLTVHNIKKVIRDYMRFAWNKCCGLRGDSSSQFLIHFRVWLWLLEEEKLLRFIDDPRNDPCYGAPCLKAICDRFHWKWIDYINPRHYTVARKFVRGQGC